MATLDMSGPFALTHPSIDRSVTRSHPGNYALGNFDGVTFYIEYVGRADGDLNTRLHQWVGMGFTHFKASYATSPKAAFEKECRNFHDFGGPGELQNDIHPARPRGSTWQCPSCSLFRLNRTGARP